MPKPNTDGGYGLPFEMDPDRTCVQLYIPDDDNHRRAFWGAIYDLTLWFNWARDEAHQGKLAADVWKDVFQKAWAQFYSDEPCPCEVIPVTDCCDPILFRLDQIIGILGGMQTLAQGEIRVTIQGSIDVNGVMGTQPSIPQTYWDDDTGSDDDPTRERYRRALCGVLEQILIQEYNRIIQSAQNTALGILPESLALLATPYAWVTGAVFIAAGLVLGGITAALDDAQARKNLVCCMIDELSGQTISRENFTAAADACAIGGNETLLSLLFKEWIKPDLNWGAMIHDLGAAFDLLDQGLPLPCACDEGDPCTGEGVNHGIDIDLIPQDASITFDQDLGLCSGFWRLVGSGMTWAGVGSDRCVSDITLRGHRLGGTAEAALVRMTLNGVVYTAEVSSSDDIGFSLGDGQLMQPGDTARFDFMGNTGALCLGILRYNYKDPA